MRGLAVAVSFVAVTSAVGCGGGSPDAFGPDPDFGTSDARLSTPTGTISRAAIGRAVDTIDVVRLPAVSITALAQVSTSHTDCDALAHHDAAGTCACPGGGMLEYDFSALAEARAHGTSAATLRMRLVHCGVAELVLDGTEFARVDGDVTRSLEARLDVTRGSATSSLDVWSVDGAWWARAPVLDGAIVVGATTAPSGVSRQIIVKDRAATWTCNVAEGAQTAAGNDGARCISPGGDVRDLQT